MNSEFSRLALDFISREIAPLNKAKSAPRNKSAYFGMWHRLTRTIAPAALPVTLAMVKVHARVDAVDEDALIAEYIDAAIALIDGPNGCGIAMINQTWDLRLDGFPHSYCEIEIPLRPVQSITSNSYQDADDVTQVLNASDYQLLNGSVYLNSGKSWQCR